MRETHVPLESVWDRLVRAVEEVSKPLSKSLKGSKLRRTSNLTFSKTGLKLHTKKQWLRLSLRTTEYATNTYKKYFYTFTINKIIFTNGERKKERPNFYGMFRQNLPISTAFIAILEMELPQCNAIGVHTPPEVQEKRTSSSRFLWPLVCSLTMSTWDPRSDDDINNDVGSLYVEIIDKNRSFYKCTICGRKLSRKQRLKPTLSRLRCCADRFVDQFQLNMTQATIRAIKSGDSMLKASLRVQFFDKERNLNGNLKATTTQIKKVGQTFSINILNPSLSC